MADEYSDFEVITSGANGNVENGLPLENSASAFQYRKLFDGFYSFGITGGSLGGTIKAKFHIRIRANAAKNKDGQYTAQILFEQVVEMRFLVVVQGIGGAVGFFFWSPLDGGDGRVTTTICDGQPVPVGEDGKPQGWKFVDTSRPTQYSEEGDVRAGEFDDVTDDMDATGDFTASAGRIWGGFQSARYKCNIPPGAILEVVEDNWQVGTQRETTYSFAFKKGASGSLWSDKVGAIRFATPQNGGTALSYVYPGFGRYSGITRRRLLTTVSGGHVVKTEDNALWLLGVEASVGRLWVSEDDGTTVEKAKRKLENGTQEEVVVFGTGFTMLGLQTGKGRMWALGRKGDNLYLSSSADKWLSVKNIGRAKSSGGYGLAVQEDGTVMVAAPDHRYVVDADSIIEAGPLATPPTP